jgi:hypothetical protein
VTESAPAGGPSTADVGTDVRGPSTAEVGTEARDPSSDAPMTRPVPIVRPPDWRVPMWTASSGAALVAVAAFLPWGGSGRVDRSSYQLARLADRLGIVGARWQHLLLVVWVLVPFIAALALLSAALARPVPVLVLVPFVAAIGIVATVVVARSPVAVRSGAWVSLAGCGCGLAGSAWLATALASGRRHRSSPLPRRTT